MTTAIIDIFRQFFQQRMTEAQPNHFNTLGIRFISIDVGRAALDLPYGQHLLACPEPEWLAGGPITGLLDTCCAMAAASTMDKLTFCPTLDLRVDHLAIAVPGKTLHAEAEVYRKSRSVIFVRGTIFQDDRDKPVATGLANFTPVEQITRDPSGKPVERISE